ncbi:MAG TPA: monovalent cation/H+ antiporter subunit D family protein [Gammaproteobacteria bacterium]
MVPALAAVGIVLFGRRPNLREAVTLVSAVTLFLLVLSLYPEVAAGKRPGITLFTMLPGLELALSIEPLGMMFGLVASFLWIVTSVYSIGYMRGNKEANQTRFYTCFAIALASTMGVAFAGNMFSLFIFYEVLTLSTYPLVTHSGTDDARRAGRVYLGILLGTSIGLQLFAVIWTWSLTGTLDFTDGGILRGAASPTLSAVLFAMYVFGIGKAALMPFHRWLPAAMVAPTPVSALLHAVAVVKAGVFSILKISVYVFGIDYLAEIGAGTWLIYVAGGTVIIASVVALSKDNLKARLAYSTVSQLSYVVIATAILAPLSVMGAAIHIAAHAFGKITLFFAAGSIYTAAHKTEVSQLDGIGRKMPWTMAAFAVGSLSMVGLPPTAGFVSKWYILMAAMEAEQLVVVGVIFASTLLNAAYFLPVVYKAFFRAAPVSGRGDVHDAHGEAPLAVVAAMVVTAIGTLMLFFIPDLTIPLARQLSEVGP